MEPVIVIGAGQSGIAAADALLSRGIRPFVLEGGADTAGSWPWYYDSLRLFTPARLDGLPGRPFPGEPDRYPTRDEVADYLRASAADLDCAVHTRQQVTSVDHEAGEYRVRTREGAEFTSRAVVAATGSFSRPHRPGIPGLDGYTGTVVHAADYRRPEPFTGQRVVVVGSGNSAVQIAVELADHARVSLASRTPLRYATNRPVPAGSRFWSVLSAAGRIPAGPLFGRGTVPIVDTGGYRAAFEVGRPDRRDLFTGAHDSMLRWPSHEPEHVDAIILATGYRPALEYLRPLGVLDEAGVPNQRFGLSRTHRGLTFVGLEYQRTILSGTLHGAGRDAQYVARTLAES